MREIKFRAWDGQKMSTPFSFWDVRSDGGPSGEYPAVIYAEHEIRVYELDPESKKYILEQFTGLVDKNGTEIYEGDILNVSEWEANPEIYKAPVQATVGWSDVRAGFVPYTETNIGNDIDEFKEEDEYEIVGNIHDTPHA